MWPFKRKVTQPVRFCDHDWRLADTFIRAFETNPYSLDFDLTRAPFFVVKCATCDRQRTLNEEDFAHFRKYFNVKLTGVADDGTA